MVLARRIRASLIMPITAIAAVAALAAALLFVAVPSVHAAVLTVTPGASVDIDADDNGTTYTALNSMAIDDDDGAAAGYADSDTIILTAPAGLEFNPSAASDQAIGAGYGTTNIDLGSGPGWLRHPRIAPAIPSRRGR